MTGPVEVEKGRRVDGPRGQRLKMVREDVLQAHGGRPGLAQVDDHGQPGALALLERPPGQEMPQVLAEAGLPRAEVAEEGEEILARPVEPVEHGLRGRIRRGLPPRLHLALEDQLLLHVQALELGALVAADAGVERRPEIHERPHQVVVGAELDEGLRRLGMGIVGEAGPGNHDGLIGAPVAFSR